LRPGPVFAHGTTGTKLTVGAPRAPVHTNLKKKKKKKKKEKKKRRFAIL
jgi:hypothetical protein